MPYNAKNYVFLFRTYPAFYWMLLNMQIIANYSVATKTIREGTDFIAKNKCWQQPNRNTEQATPICGSHARTAQRNHTKTLWIWRPSQYITAIGSCISQKSIKMNIYEDIYSADCFCWKSVKILFTKSDKHPLYTVRYGSYGNSVQIKRKIHPASLNLKCDSKRIRKLRILTVNALCFS